MFTKHDPALCNRHLGGGVAGVTVLPSLPVLLTRKNLDQGLYKVLEVDSKISVMEYLEHFFYLVKKGPEQKSVENRTLDYFIKTY